MLHGKRGRLTTRRDLHEGCRDTKTTALVSISTSYGCGLTIGVTAPDSKNWWRNFLGDGAPITLLNLDGRDRNGHAVANRDARGRVSVTVRLDP